MEQFLKLCEQYKNETNQDITFLNRYIETEKLLNLLKIGMVKK